LRYYANGNYSVWEATLFVIKILFSVALLLAAAEIAKRSTFFGALIIALPLTSMLAMTWLGSLRLSPPRIALPAKCGWMQGARRRS
jgi:hypothetical protein